MNVYIAGTDGVGGYFGGLPSKTGNDVIFAARSENYKGYY